MVAYSFKECFVLPIQIGLGIKKADPEPGAPRAKRQTIREEGLRRHAIAGDELQLYCGMRTRTCFLIGKGRCTKSAPIYLEVEAPLIIIGEGRDLRRITTRSELNVFAQGDGFTSWEAMALFWYQNHHATMNDFRGRIIFWEPLGT